MSDFNFLETDWANKTTYLGDQHMASRFIETIRDTVLFQHINKPTRIREENKPSTLDLIFFFFFQMKKIWLTILATSQVWVRVTT